MSQLKQHSWPELLLLGEVGRVMQEHPSIPMGSQRHSTTLNSFSLWLLRFVIKDHENHSKLVFSSAIKSTFNMQNWNVLYSSLFFTFQCGIMSFLNSSTSPAAFCKLLSAEHYHVAALLSPPVMRAQVTGYSINSMQPLPKTMRFTQALKETTPKQRNFSVTHPFDVLHQSSSI